MTEDDTFEALRRLPYHEMAVIYTNWVLGNRDINTLDEKLVELLKGYGWTVEEFDAIQRKFYRMHNDEDDL